MRLRELHPRGYEWAVRAEEEGRVIDYAWDGESASAVIVGDGDVYVSYLGRDGWSCSCLGSLRRPCKHVILLAIHAARVGDVDEGDAARWIEEAWARLREGFKEG